MWKIALAPILAMLALVACGSDPAVPTLLVTDVCGFDGPTTLRGGTARLTLQRTGLGDYGAVVARLEDGHDVADLEEHFSTVSEIWDERPEWLVINYSVQVDDTDVDSPTGDTELIRLNPGSYAVVCINYSDDRAGVASAVEVIADSP